MRDEPPDWGWTEDNDMPSEAELNEAVARRAYRDRPESAHLTEEQLAVLRYLSHGLTPGEIARESGLSIDVVRDRIRRARQRLAAKTVEQAVADAIRNGLID